MSRRSRTWCSSQSQTSLGIDALRLPVSEAVPLRIDRRVALHDREAKTLDSQSFIICSSRHRAPSACSRVKPNWAWSLCRSYLGPTLGARRYRAAIAMRADERPTPTGAITAAHSRRRVFLFCQKKRCKKPSHAAKRVSHVVDQRFVVSRHDDELVVHIPRTQQLDQADGLREFDMRSSSPCNEYGRFPPVIAEIAEDWYDVIRSSELPHSARRHVPPAAKMSESAPAPRRKHTPYDSPRADSRRIDVGRDCRYFLQRHVG